MYYQSFIVLASVTSASINVRRAGWLDRVVEYQKQQFLDDLKKLPDIKFQARIERPPPGYVDSKDWDYDSVIRLLTLIRESEGAKAVRLALGHAMRKNRRFMSLGMSWKYFPSLAKDSVNNFYYHADSGEVYADIESKFVNQDLQDDDVIIVRNPVEAKLPNARISIRLLKSILERRAELARSMPTTKKIIPWSPITTQPTTPQTTLSGENSNNTVEDTPFTDISGTSTSITTVA